MRAVVSCFGQLRLVSIATGASLGFLLACGGSGEGGLFSKGQGGTPSSAGSASNAGAPGLGGGSTQGGSVSASGGSSSGGVSANGGAPSGGSVTGGGISAGGATATGGQASSAGGTSTPGGAANTGGNKSTGGATTTTGGQGASTGGTPSTGGADATGGGPDGAAGEGGTGGGCSPSVERCDGLDNDCNGMIDEKGCPAKCTGFALADHGYMVCDVELNATKASTLCEDQGLRLAWIESADENAELLAKISSLGSSGRGGGILEVSIGATDSEQEGHWHWRGGEDFWLGGGKGSPVGGAYTNWANGRPNNTVSSGGNGAAAGEDCAVVVIDQPDDGQPGQWNDVECSLQYAVLCEEP
jgi:hypothetical protein